MDKDWEGRDPVFLQVRKPEFERVRAMVQQSLLRDEPRGDAEPRDYRAVALNELARRDQLLRGGEDHELFSNRLKPCFNFIKAVTDDAKLLSELMELMLASCGDELPAELVQAASDIKEGVETQAPPSEDQVAEVKQKLAGGLAGMFKKPAAAAVPNFAQMFLEPSEDQSTDCLTDIFKDPEYDCGRLGHRQHDTDLVDTDESLNDDGFFAKPAQVKLTACFTGLKVLNEALCRDTLVTIMSQMADQVSDESRQLLNKEELRTRLDDLVHNYHMTHAHQSLDFQNPARRQRSEQKIREVLTFFQQSEEIRRFLVDDLIKRGKETMTNVSKSWASYDRYMRLDSFREKVQLEAILDPVNLMLLTRYFIELDYIEAERLPTYLVAFFDLTMLYALVMVSDRAGLVGLELLDHACWLAHTAKERVELFAGKEEELKRLTENGIVFKLSLLVEDGELNEYTKEKNQFLGLIEVGEQLRQLKDAAQEKLGVNVEASFFCCPKVEEQLKAIAVLRDGTKFTSQIHEVVFSSLLAANDPQVSQMGASYETFARPFNAPISMSLGPREEDWTLRMETLKSNDFIKVERDDGALLLADRSAFQSNATTEIVCKAGQTLKVSFPAKPQVVKWTGCLKTRGGANRERYTRLDRFDLMMETAAFSPVAVTAASDHVTFRAADGSIYGIGKHANHHSYSAEPEREALRKIELPDGVSPSEIQKVCEAKFARGVWLKDGRFFFNGHAKWYDYTNTNTSNATESFEERFENNFWRLDADNKPVDWVSGYHYNAVQTAKGELHCQGYVFWRNFASSVRHNNEDYEDHPFRVDPPEGYAKLVKIHPVMKGHRIRANYEKADGTRRTFEIGETRDNAGNWNELALPAGRHFTKAIGPAWSAFSAIDDEQRLWLWDYNESVSAMMPESAECFENGESAAPNHFKWFTERKIKVLDIEGGHSFVIALTEDADGKREFYGLGTKLREKHDGEQNVFPDRFGPNAKAVYKNSVFLLTDVDADSVASFACTYDAVFFVMKDNAKQPVSIIPSKPEATGLIHFYKEGDEWRFVEEGEYEEKKGDLPPICFATRSPIANFGERQFMDLEQLAASAPLEAEGEPTYYSKFVARADPGEVPQSVTASEAQALAGNQPHELNPVIYVRTKTPAPTLLERMDTIALDAFFELREGEHALGFSFFRSSLSSADHAQLVPRDEEREYIAQLRSFTPADDAQLISEMDTLAREKQCRIVALNPTSIEPSSFCMSAESALWKKGERLLKQRCKLLLAVLKGWIHVAGFFNMKKKHVEGSVARLLHGLKFLMPPSVSGQLVDAAVERIDTGYGSRVSVSRRKAMVFADSGKIDHEGKYSMYGQIVQQLISNHPDMANFRMRGTDDKCYDIDFRGEGSIDAGGPFRESLTNIANELESGVVPVLIRSPNNRNEHGINRECFILDSRSKTPSHKTMFRYFGGFLAFAFLTKSPLPYNLAPWVWKQLVEESVTLDDLEGIDAYSAQVLRDLQQYSQTLSDEDFEAGVEQYFTTVLSTGEEVPLCPGGESIRVTKQNLPEFVDKVLEARRNEAAVQVEAIRGGFLQVLQNNTTILDVLSWQTLEARCTGEKHISLERLKSITEFPNNGSDHEIIPRFWRVFEAWSDVERSAYLKFVWGRSRLPIDLSRLNNKHQVRLMSDMNGQAFPQAHTCFFQLDVPNYATDELMNHRLSTAAQLCGEMDTDNTATEDLD